MRELKTLLLSTAIFSGVWAPAAFAEEEATILDTIFVTGLKRADELFELPGSASVVEGDGITTDSDTPGAAITRSTPNAYMGGYGQPGLDWVSIRGVGPLGQPANSLDNSVGFSTNGAATSAFGYPPSLLDVERIEVFRGPQGTLFGRNAMGGLINVVTREADGEREFKLRGEYGTEGHYLAEAIAAGWLKEDLLAARLAARFQGQNGDVPNVVVGGDEGDSQLAAMRGTVQYTPSEYTRVNLILGYDRDEQHNNYSLYYQYPDFPTSGSDVIPENTRDRAEGTLQFEHDFENFTFTSLTNLQDIRLYGKVDTADELLFPAVGYPIPARGGDISIAKERDLIFNQEFRLNSSESSAVSWVAGVNYFRSDYSMNRDQDSTYSPYSSGKWDTDITAQTFALFGDVSLPLTDKLKIHAGGRIAHDRQELDVTYTGKGFPTTVSSYSQDSETSDTYATGRFAVSFDWTDSFMTYASVSTGYASGGYERFTLNAAVGEPVVPFKPSTIIAYEAGARTKLFDDRLQLGVSVYYNDVNDGQLTGYDLSSLPITFNFVNQDYQTYGGEIEARAEVVDGLTIGGGVGLNISELDAPTAETAVLGVEEGNRVPNTPKFTVSADVDYRFLEDFYAKLQYQYVGQRAMDLGNTQDLPDYHIINTRLGWNKGRFEVYAYGNNLLDERPIYFGAPYSTTVSTAAVGPGRTLGLGVSLSF